MYISSEGNRKGVGGGGGERKKFIAQNFTLSHAAIVY